MGTIGRSLLKEIDFTPDEFLYLVALGDQLRRAKGIEYLAGFRRSPSRSWGWTPGFRCGTG